MPVPPEGRPVELGFATHCGQVREHNEDAYVAFQLGPDRNSWHLDAVIAVADGLGGHLAGEVASRIAAETLTELLAPEQPPQLPWLPWARSPRGAVQRAIREANSRIYAESQQEAGRLQMGTTLTAVLLHGRRMTVGHVGDSRAYLIRGGQISQITEDHTWVGEQVKRGVLTPEEAAVSPFRNQIVRSVGTSDTTEADILTEPLVEGDIVLACSDGLADMVDDQTICATFVSSADLQGACDRLVELANQAGGRDNITVVAARYRDATEAGALSPTPEPESEK